MAGTDLDIQYIAHLARLDLTDEEQERLGRQLEPVLGYMDKLKELDVSGVEPMAHALPRANVFRNDEVSPSLPHTEALRNAPSRANGLFVVPKIVE
jgi:aspartyl-tRNA(Asn)/glutamyl-tRNA(Gln) amidotransferase subunit C